MATQTQVLTSYAPARFGLMPASYSEYIPAKPASLEASVAVTAVRDLINAAGALTTHDIAGGLDISLYEAAAVVARMTDEGCLGKDEWERNRLSGACRN